MENPQTLTLTLGPVAHGGHCVARYEGRVIFVRHGIPGEVVRVALTEHDDGASFWRADVTDVLEASTDRVPHFWAEADALKAADAGRLPVGGAEFGHISRARQRRLKAEVLAEQLRRLAGIDIGGGQNSGGGQNNGTVVVDGGYVAHGESLGAPLLAAGVENVDSGGAVSGAAALSGAGAGGADTPGAGLGWRTRAGFAVTGPASVGSAKSGTTITVEPGRLGMHAHRSAAVLPVRDMPLACAGINALRLWEIDLTGIIRIEISAPANGSAPLVLLATDPQLSAKARGLTLKRIASQLQQHAVAAGAARAPGAAGTSAAPSPGSAPAAAAGAAKALAGPEGADGPDRHAAAIRSAVSVAGWDPESGALTPVSGRTWVSESAAGHEFRVSGGGFWQIHRRAPEVLTGAVMDFLTGGAGGAGRVGGSRGRDGAGLLFPGAAVADLYAGAGLFTASLADAVGPTGSVLSVEGSAGASKDARKNLHAASQVEIEHGRVERVLQAQRGRDGNRITRRFDAVVLDPPRAGAGKTVVRQLIASAPRAVVYVSCDPASFARDVGYFRTAGWNLSRLRALDLYPHTHHLETVALLTPGAGS